MYVDDLIWLPSVVEKLARKHNVRPEEVEEVFLNRPRFRFHERGSVQGEDLYVALYGSIQKADKQIAEGDTYSFGEVFGDEE